MPQCVTLDKQVKDLYVKTFKTLKKEILPCLWTGRINIVNMASLPSTICRFNVIPIDIQTPFLQSLKDKFSHSYGKTKNPGQLKQS